MNDKEDIFEKALESLKNAPVPPGPPQELVDATMAQLSERAGVPTAEQLSNGMWLRKRLKLLKGFGRVAAAAAVLIATGYAAGRWSAPRPLDMEQIRAAIEPAIRQNLLDETRQYVRLSLTNGLLQVKDELSEQYRQELSRVAMQTLAASNTMTNELLAQLVESINTTQIEDRWRFAAALEQIALIQLRDRNQLSSAFATFAVRTEDELMQTKKDVKDVAQALSYARPSSDGPDSLTPYEPENLDNSNERNKK